MEALGSLTPGLPSLRNGARAHEGTLLWVLLACPSPSFLLGLVSSQSVRLPAGTLWPKEITFLSAREASASSEEPNLKSRTFKTTWKIVLTNSKNKKIKAWKKNGIKCKFYGDYCTSFQILHLWFNA